jgi:hypothetical protein
MNVLLCVELLGTIFLEQTPLIYRIKVSGILCAKYSFPINELFVIESL